MRRLLFGVIAASLLAIPASAQIGLPAGQAQLVPFTAAGASCAPYQQNAAAPYQNFATPPYQTGC